MSNMDELLENMGKVMVRKADMKHFPNDLQKLVHDRTFDQQAHWVRMFEENPEWRYGVQMAFQTTQGKTIYHIKSKNGTASYYVLPDVVDLFKNDPDVMIRELRRLAQKNCLPIMPTQAHPTSAHTLSLAYDNERLIDSGHNKKWEFRKYQVGRWYYHGVGYETDGKFIILESDGRVFHTVDIAHATRQ